MSNEKAMIIHFRVKKIIKKMNSYPPSGNSGNKVKVDLDLSNYATKSDFKNITGADTLQIAKKDDLANVKSEVANLDIGKLETTPTDLSKLSNVVKKQVVKKTEYDELVRNVNAIDTSKLVNKRNYNAKKKNIEDKIPSITNLATTAAITAVKKKMPSITILVKKKEDYDAKISEIEKKYFANDIRI